MIIQMKKAKSEEVWRALYGAATFIPVAGKVIVAVDEDIDPSNLYDVIWAMGTRCDVENIEILRGIWSAMTPPLVKPQLKAGKFPVSSRAVVDACRPYDWMKEFPPVNVFTREYKRGIAEKFGIQMKKK